jgi:hypothetical protein
LRGGGGGAEVCEGLRHVRDDSGVGGVTGVFSGGLSLPS